MKPIIIFHGNCMDGIAAAWGVYDGLRHLPELPEFVQGYYGNPPPAIKGRDVYIVDFSYPANVMEQIIAEANMVVVLDHHASAKQACQNVTVDESTGSKIIFDMNRSGAMLAWDFFHSEEPPLVLQYIQDRDLWTWKLPYSQEINMFLRNPDIIDPNKPMEAFLQLSKFAAMPDADFLGISVPRGEELLKARDRLVEECTKNWFVVTMQLPEGEVLVPACFAPSSIASECGNTLAYMEGAEVGVVFGNLAFGKFACSIRGRKGTDLAKRLALHYGGGGHDQAAGCGLEPGIYAAIIFTAIGRTLAP